MTLWLTKKPSKPRKPSRGFPWPSLGRGAGEIPATHFGEGAGLKGHQTKQHFDPRDQKCHTNKPNKYPQKPQTTKPLTNQTKSRRNCQSKVEGPMGRPALLGRHPRGPQYRGVQVPPHYGNRPRWRKSWHSSRHKTDTPKAMSWRLASPHDADTHPTPS